MFFLNVFADICFKPYLRMGLFMALLQKTSDGFIDRDHLRDKDGQIAGIRAGASFLFMRNIWCRPQDPREKKESHLSTFDFNPASWAVCPNDDRYSQQPIRCIQTKRVSGKTTNAFEYSAICSARYWKHSAIGWMSMWSVRNQPDNFIFMHNS